MTTAREQGEQAFAEDGLEAVNPFNVIRQCWLRCEWEAGWSAAAMTRDDARWDGAIDSYEDRKANGY